MKTTLRALSVLAVLLCVACQGAGELVDSFKELQTVQREVAAATHYEGINVILNNGRYLAVSIINSPFKALPDDQKKLKAREIAGIAFKALPSRAKLASVTVVFLVHKTYFLFFNYTDGTDSHSFPASDLVVEPPVLRHEIK